MQARSYVEEDLLPNSELTNEKEMASKRCRGQVKIHTKRLTFFASLPRSRTWQDPNELPDRDILGYAIIATLTLPNKEKRTFLLEAVVRPPGRSHLYPPEDPVQTVMIELPHYYIQNAREFTTTVGTKEKENHREFSIHGSFFTQQNDLTSVCAHAALRMAVNSSGTDFLRNLAMSKLGNDGKLTNKHINDFLGINFSTPETTIGHFPKDPPNTKEGLLAEEMKHVVEELGCELRIIDFVGDVGADYDQIMHPMLESGFPTILEVQGWNTNKREYYAHALSVNGHTLNSDRWTPQATIGYGEFPIMPYIPASSWNDLIKDGILEPTASQLTYIDTLPNDLWVIEVTIPNLLVGNKAKLGDIVFNAKASANETRAEADDFVLAWLPGLFRYGLGSNKADSWFLLEYAPLIRSTQPPFNEW